MKTRKLLTVSIMALLLLGLLQGAVLAAGPTYKIILNGPMPESHNLTKAERMFADLVEKRTGGRVQVEVFPNATLGGGREALEAVRSGIQTMVDAALAPVVSYEPAFGVLSLPYLFNSREEWYALLDGPLGQELLAKLEKSGFVGLGFPENGVRHITNSVRPITKPEDLKGIKIRIMESPVMRETFNSLGALPAPIAWTELYSALQQHVVDAQENPIVNIYSSKLYEPQKYLSLTGHFYDANIYFINKAFWDSLPADIQKTIREVAKEVIAWQRKQAQENEKTQLQALRKLIQVNEVSPEQLARFRAVTRQAYKKTEGLIGKDTIENWVKATEDWEKKH